MLGKKGCEKKNLLLVDQVVLRELNRVPTEAERHRTGRA
jgi:hypothetical protein|tara:strand:- start:25 stop:141 length:117 start_codon:yes stop_codon:yes gene_type:complete